MQESCESAGDGLSETMEDCSKENYKFQVDDEGGNGTSCFVVKNG